MKRIALGLPWGLTPWMDGGRGDEIAAMWD